MQPQQQRLYDAFQQLVESLQQLSDALTALSAKLGASAYERFHEPFGPSDAAREIWLRYRQYTTNN